MNISLFLENELLEFKIPQIISGEYNFDYDDKEESKLINIKAKDGKWYLYSTTNTSIIDNGIRKEEIELKKNTYYKLKRNNKEYIISATNIEIKTHIYKYDDSLNIIMGNSNNCNIKLKTDFINSPIFKLYVQENKLILEQLINTSIYINKVKTFNQYNELKNEDIIDYYNLKIYCLKKLLLISSPYEITEINEQNAKIEKYLENNIESNNKKDEIKDVDLYTEDSYFSKSPVLRRFIEQKKIKVEASPKEENNSESPLLLTLAPMLTMAITSITTLTNTIVKLNSGEADIKNSWPQLVTGTAMMLSSLVWPLVTKLYDKHKKENQKQEIKEKYTKYLMEKEKEFAKEKKEQQEILIETYIPLNKVIEQIEKKGLLFWNKRTDQNDFLKVRVGIGNEKLDVDIDYNKEEFSIDESELRDMADNLIEKYKYIPNVPISYDLYKDNIVAIMGKNTQVTAFTNNILLQLLAFYDYEELKIVVITNKENESNWEYLKYVPHTFTNDKKIRFFGTTDNSIKSISDYLRIEALNRKNSNTEDVPKPYYIIISDDMDKIKNEEFVTEITESKDNLGFSLIILENKLSKMPSKCNNFISLTGQRFSILKNKENQQEIINFTDEINYDIDKMKLAKIMANIPIEFQEGVSQLPEKISFLEMEKVGNINQLNILNRWNTNDPISSLKAEVGVGDNNDLIYLDLHEKYHGPHGLIAGTTGSGKSEFIITYVLSLAINYSPDYVSFILIDYKGGGLAGAFENKLTGVRLPHLAGTITNLDKAEMDRTLVSIDSEAKRRQKLFNEARDKLNESTMDIYKYQQFYKDGKLEEALPHLFIISDEFAELKAQQPEFMDNLISIARIGRSLGVHLILATQKPSGVVNDQIWSNTKFRVCLKVASEADSKEMLKRPEAAHITEAGRFFLQVGMDEIFEQGQSGYCGAKYYPSDKIVKEVDKSVCLINDLGSTIKKAKIKDQISKKSQGEQLQNILKEIISIANKENLKSKKLWLDNIPPIILVDELIKKYNITKEKLPETIIGEYDYPEKQEQGLLKYNYLEDGNLLIYGLDSEDKEMLLKTIIYSTAKNYTAEEINMYIIDYGSESLRIFEKLPQVGGMVYAGDEERFNNLLKLIKEEIKKRKRILADFGGEYKNYIKNNKESEKMPVISIIINNLSGINEAYNDFSYDVLPSLCRDSERYGIIFIVVGTNEPSINQKLAQNYENKFAFRLKEQIDFKSLFASKKNITLREEIGRGIYKTDDIHEFQTASIVEKQEELNDKILNFIEEQVNKNKIKAKPIPAFPRVVRYENIQEKINDLKNIPIGIRKSDLEIETYDLTETMGLLICTNKIDYAKIFSLSLIILLQSYSNNITMVIDAGKNIEESQKYCKNYYNNNFDDVNKMIVDYISKLNDKNLIIVIYGVDKYVNKLEEYKIDKLLKELNKTEQVKIIIIEENNKIKNYVFTDWFKSICLGDGIWIGNGVQDQQILKTGTYNKELSKLVSMSIGYKVYSSMTSQIKLIDFITPDKDIKDDE